MILLVILISTLVSADSSTNRIISEGETQIITVGTIPYAIKLIVVADNSEKAIFEVNGKRTKAIGSREGYDFLDGSKIRVGDVFLQEGGDGPDMLEYFFYAPLGTQSVVDEDEYAIGSIQAPTSLPSVDKVSYEDLIPIFQQQKTVPISEQTKQVSPEITADEEYDKYPITTPQEQTPKSKGFFARIFDWFLNIFR